MSLAIMPPHSDEAEQAALGAALIHSDSEVFERIRAATRITPRKFYDERHQWIWRAMERLVEQGVPIDYLTLVAEMKKVGKLKEIGGEAYILGLVTATPSALNAIGYAKLVTGFWWRRDLIRKAERLAQLAHDGKKTEAEISEEVVTMMSTNGDGLVQPFRTSKSLFGGFGEEMEKRAQGKAGFNTGLFELDRVMAGRYRPGEYTIVQGLTNIGKSFLVLQMAAATLTQSPVLFFCFQDTDTDVRDRLVAMRAGIPMDEVSSGKFTGDNAKKAARAAAWFEDKPLEIVSNLSTVAQIRGHIEGAIIRHDYQRPMVFIDTLNDIAEAMPGGLYQNLTQVSAQFLQIVRELGVGLVATAQQNNLYSPDMSTKAVKKALTPTMRTVEGSRKLAQHPHNMIGLYSADYIAKKIVKGEYKDDECPPGHTMIVNCRQRNARGAISAVVKWQENIPRFETKQNGNGKGPMTHAAASEPRD